MHITQLQAEQDAAGLHWVQSIKELPAARKSTYRMSMRFQHDGQAVALIGVGVHDEYQWVRISVRS
jgi:hypothetical protein